VIKTDWNKYYGKPYKTATFTRRITGRVLLDLIKRYVQKEDNFTIVELGGADSCFYELLNMTLAPSKYLVIDNNQLGLDRLRERTAAKKNLTLMNKDILNFDLKLHADLTFSIGLIEHFSVEDTKKAIISHFTCMKKEGILIMSFPTPTFLYRITRKISELLGLWIFHDERPLEIQEVTDTVKQFGDILDQKILWSIVLTQGFIIARKR
jgi:hypothetical protein